MVSKTTLSILALALAGLPTHAASIASTDFDGRTVIGTSSETATNLNWSLNGVDDPGDLTSLRAGNPQALFDGTTLTQNLFAGAWNYGNSNEYWYTSVPLTVSAGSVVTLTDVTFNYVAINGSQGENVGRRADFTVKIFSPTAVELDSIDNFDIWGGTTGGYGQPLVTSTFGAPIALSEPGTYIVEIQAGELGGVNETGNHAGIDNLSINGTVVPEPSALLLGSLSLCALLRRRRL